MSMRKRLTEWLKRPHGWGLFPIYLITVLFCLCSIVLTISGGSLGILAYCCFGIAALSLGYMIYTLVLFAPSWKRNFTAFLRRFRFTDRLMEQYGFRTIVFALVSFIVSLAYVCVNGVVAVMARSIWYGALAAYYLMLAVMHGGVLLFHRSKRRKKDDLPEEERRRETKIYGGCGVGLVFLPICLSFAILQMVNGENSFEYAGVMIYVSATYAFYKIIMSVVNLVRARKEDDFTVKAVRSVNLADAMVSILALQTAMFKEFSGGVDVGFFNALTGTAVCALTIALGIYMIVCAKNRLKQMKKENINGRTE